MFSSCAEIIFLSKYLCVCVLQCHVWACGWISVNWQVVYFYNCKGNGLPEPQISYLSTFEYTWQEAPFCPIRTLDTWGVVLSLKKEVGRGTSSGIYLSWSKPFFLTCPCGSFLLALKCIIQLKLPSVPWQPGPFGRGPAVQTHIITRVCCSGLIKNAKNRANGKECIKPSEFSQTHSQCW